MSRQLSNKVCDDKVDHFRHFSYTFNHCSGDWNVNYFYDGNQRGGRQSYPSMRNTIQCLIAKAAPLDTHRKHQERAPPPGMIPPQDGSNHEWASGKKWSLIAIMDGATGEHHSMVFVPEQGTASSFQGVRDVIQKQGFFAYYIPTGETITGTRPRLGGRVRKTQFTPCGQAMSHLGIEMIPTYSPEAEGRSEKGFRTHQNRLPEKLAVHGINEMDDTNRNLDQVYKPTFNTESTQPAAEKCFSFVLRTEANLDDILCEKYKQGTADAYITFEGYSLADPCRQGRRCHYVKVIRACLPVHGWIVGSFPWAPKMADYGDQDTRGNTESEGAA